MGTSDAHSIQGDGAIVESRLSPPELPRGHVARRALIDTLGEHDAGLVSVTAPAGYGKTTLLAEWARTERRPVAWVSLDRADNDPVSLMAAVAAVFGRTQGYERGFWESMSSPGASVLGRLGPRLADAMGSAGHPFVMVLDDMHEVSDTESCDVIDLLAGRVPPRSTLAVSGRVEPQSLPTWRARGNVLEISAESLAFDVDESTRFLELAGASGIPNDTVAALHSSLEGWVAGLQLALVISRRQPFDGFGVGDRFIGDYLRREVLDGLSTEHHEFLTRTAVLDELSGPLCDALLARDDSTTRLEELERAGLFLVPLDRQRSRYRYHAAFRELLLAEFDRTEGGDARRRLHLQASKCLDELGMVNDAVEHALRSNESEWTAPLVAKSALDVIERGRIATLERWLDQLGDDAILGYPPLAVQAGWVAAYSGDARNAQRWLDQVGGLSFDGEPPDGTTSFESARAMFRAFSCPNGPADMLTDAEFAIAAEPLWGPWRSTAVGLGAEALLLRGLDGDRERAWSLFGDAIDSARASSIVECLVVCLAERALLAMNRSGWSSAREDLTEALAAVEQYNMEDYVTSLLAYAAAARLALHHGETTSAGRFVTRAMRARGIATHAVPYWAVRLRLVLARVHLAMGETVAARHLFREVDDVLRQRPDLGTLVGEAAQLQDFLAGAPNQGGASPLSPAELRVLPYLQTHLTFEEIASRLYVSRHTTRTHAGSIYRKLGASSRSEAVVAAIAVGLLGDLRPDVTG